MREATEKCPRCCDTATADDREVREAEAETEGSSCCCRHKKRSEEEYKSLIHRLNRIEGQIRGIRGMVEKDIYCADILVQVAAVNSALNGFPRSCWPSMCAPAWRTICGRAAKKSWTS